MRIIAIIPARYASERLPGKPLLPICGKPMIQHVYERAQQAQGLDAVYVATDDTRIADAVASFGGKAIMTSVNCASGSDRIYEVACKKNADFYINIQGDEPLLRPEDISLLTNALRTDSSIQVATLCCPIDATKAQDPNCVKVVCNDDNNALYFSRAPIPYVRAAQTNYLGHIGIYAYKAEILKCFASMPTAHLENVEKLEQLRLLQANISIRVLQTDVFGHGVDTPEDLENMRKVLGHYGDTIPQNISNSNKLSGVKLVISDIDGVLTNGTLYYGAEGESLKPFNVRDGLGIRLLQKAGIQVAVLSGRNSSALQARLKDLDIDNYILGEFSKKQACQKIISKAQVNAHETLFIGDDLPDAVAFQACGIGVTVADGIDFIKEKADIILDTKGGCGAFRELAEAILQAQGRDDLLRPSEDLSLKNMVGPHNEH